MHRGRNISYVQQRGSYPPNLQPNFSSSFSYQTDVLGINKCKYTCVQLPCYDYALYKSTFYLLTYLLTYFVGVGQKTENSDH